jgi:hypothetical protein
MRGRPRPQALDLLLEQQRRRVEAVGHGPGGAAEPVVRHHEALAQLAAAAEGLDAAAAVLRAAGLQLDAAAGAAAQHAAAARRDGAELGCLAAEGLLLPPSLTAAANELQGQEPSVGACGGVPERLRVTAVLAGPHGSAATVTLLPIIAAAHSQAPPPPAALPDREYTDEGLGAAETLVGPPPPPPEPAAGWVWTARLAERAGEGAAPALAGPAEGEGLAVLAPGAGAQLRWWRAAWSDVAAALGACAAQG